jgi:hypothetical protein
MGTPHAYTLLYGKLSTAFEEQFTPQNGSSWFCHRDVLMWGADKTKTKKHSILTDLLFWWWHNPPVIRFHAGNREERNAADSRDRVWVDHYYCACHVLKCLLVFLSWLQSTAMRQSSKWALIVTSAPYRCMQLHLFPCEDVSCYGYCRFLSGYI